MAPRTPERLGAHRTVTLVGFKTAVLNSVRVNAAVPASVRVTLELGGVEETVLSAPARRSSRRSRRPSPRPSTPNEILKLPTGSRNALDFITSLPGVNTPAGNRVRFATRSGTNEFRGSSQGNLPGQPGLFRQFDKGVNAYNTDRNNFAPSLGGAWTVGSRGPLGAIVVREPGDSVLRGGYTLAYERPGTADFATAIDDNPGISQTANRNHSVGNLGTPGSIPLCNRAELGPPAFATTRSYSMTDVITGDIMTFDPNLQVPYSQTWTGGWQRKLTGDLAFEVRYVGTRSLKSWQTYNYTEVNIVENGFLNEFRQAQQNLPANIAAARGNTFAYTGAPGTAPRPIFLAYFNGLPASQAGNTASYMGTSWTTPPSTRSSVADRRESRLGRPAFQRSG